MFKYCKLLATRRMAVMLLQGFSSGLPLALIASTLQAWFASSGIDVVTIGILSLIGQPYVYKFLWSPIFDRYMLPFLGRRRGWLLVCQALLALGVFTVAFLDPLDEPLLIGILAFFIAFFSASQDILIDAYRTELLQPHERGAGVSLYNTGYRVALLVAGGGALILADQIGWQTTFIIMAGLLALQLFVTLWAKEPTHEQHPETLRHAVIHPFQDFFKRKMAVMILLFIVLYKLTDVVTLSLGSKFLIDLGFSLTTIGAVYKGIGLIATLTGALLGGFLMMRTTLYRSLLSFGLLQTFSNLTFAWLAIVGSSLSVLTIAVATESFCSGLATTAFVAFLMSLCNKRYTATQYALFSSLAVFGRTYIGPFAGLLAKHLQVEANPAHWAVFYIWAFAVGFPGLLLLMWLHKKEII